MKGENMEKVKAQDMDIDACKELVGEIVKQMFKELKEVATCPSYGRVYKILAITRLEHEICDNMFTKYVLTDVVGTIESFIREVCPLEQRDKNNYEIKDKRTGVKFISYLSNFEVEELRERGYLKITKIEKGEE